MHNRIGRLTCANSRDLATAKSRSQTVGKALKAKRKADVADGVNPE